MQDWLCLGAFPDAFFTFLFYTWYRLYYFTSFVCVLELCKTQSVLNILCSLFCGKLKTRGGRLRKYWDLFTESRYVCFFFLPDRKQHGPCLMSAFRLWAAWVSWRWVSTTCYMEMTEKLILVCNIPLIKFSRNGILVLFNLLKVNTDLCSVYSDCLYSRDTCL